MATSNAVLKRVKGIFANSLMGDNVDAYNDIYTRVSSKSDSEKYYFADVISGVSELMDEVKLSEYKDYAYEIKNKKWSVGLRENRDLIEDSEEDLPGLLEARTIDLADEFRDQPEVLINTLLDNGTTATAFDGSPFFSTSRPNLKEGGDYSNQIDQTSSSVAIGNIEIDFGKAIGRANAMVDANGRPFNKNVKKWIAVVPAHLADKFERLANAEYIADGVTNIYKGRFTVRVKYGQPATDNTWFLVNGDKADSFIFQDRTGVEWFVDDNNKVEFIDFYAKARHNAGYGNFAHIIMVTTS